MKTIQRILVAFLSVLMIVCLAACGCKTASAASSACRAEQIANPYTECKTLEEAEKISGVTIRVPSTITDEFSICTYRAMEGMIEITYTDGKNGDEINIRKGTGSNDISGDYNNYAETNKATVEANSVTLKGDNGKISLAVWTADNQAYAVFASISGAGVDKTMMMDIINSIDSADKESINDSETTADTMDNG